MLNPETNLKAGVALVTQTMTPKGFLQDGDHREAVSELRKHKHYYTQAFVRLVFRRLGTTWHEGF